MKTRVMQDEPDKPVVHEAARRPARRWGGTTSPRGWSAGRVARQDGDLRLVRVRDRGRSRSAQRRARDCSSPTERRQDDQLETPKTERRIWQEACGLGSNALLPDRGRRDRRIGDGHAEYGHERQGSRAAEGRRRARRRGRTGRDPARSRWKAHRWPHRRTRQRRPQDADAAGRPLQDRQPDQDLHRIGRAPAGRRRETRLDDSVEQRLPGLVPNGGKITIRQLLNHTSGLPTSSSRGS